MPKKIAKQALVAGALVVAATAIGYTHGATFKTPDTSEIAAVVTPQAAAPTVQAEKIAAFVTSTRTMGEPAIATLAEMKAAETLQVTQASLIDPQSSLIEDTEFDTLVAALGVERNLIEGDVTMPPSRPVQTAVVNPVVIQELDKQQSRTRGGTKKPRPVVTKRRVWSTGEYR